MPSPASKGFGKGALDSVGALTIEEADESEEELVEAAGVAVPVNLAAGGSMLLASALRYIAGTGAGCRSKMISSCSNLVRESLLRLVWVPASAACTGLHEASKKKTAEINASRKAGGRWGHACRRLAGLGRACGGRT